MLGSPSDTLITPNPSYEYEPVVDWVQLPKGRQLHDVCGVAVDSHGNVHAFNRGGSPVMVFDHMGRFLRSWGEDLFKRPHGAFIDKDDMIWLTDDHDHTVRKCTLDGVVVMLLGVPGQPERFMSGLPFNRPTHTAISPSGDFYVSDGYGNARVHKYTAEGAHILSWGRPGTDPGEFNIVHNLTCDDQGRVYVADRENHRVQIFDSEGNYLSQWNNFYRPAGLYTTRGDNPITFIGEGGPQSPISKAVPNLGARVSIMDSKGKRIGRIGGWQPGTGPREFLAPHSIALDAQGNLYVGEVSFSNWPKKFPDKERPTNLASLRKFRRIHDH